MSMDREARLAQHGTLHIPTELTIPARAEGARQGTLFMARVLADLKLLGGIDRDGI